jgi:hypothetical protein
MRASSNVIGTANVEGKKKTKAAGLLLWYKNTKITATKDETKLRTVTLSITTIITTIGGAQQSANSKQQLT